MGGGKGISTLRKEESCVLCKKNIEDDEKQLGHQYHKDCYRRFREFMVSVKGCSGIVPLHDYKVKEAPIYDVEPYEIVHEFLYIRNEKEYLIRVLLDFENILTVFVYDNDKEGLLRYDNTSSENVWYVFNNLLVPKTDIENYALSIIDKDKERADKMFSMEY